MRATQWDRTEEAGASSVEYGLLLSLIALIIMVGVGTFGTSLGNAYDDNCDDVSVALTSTTC